MQQAAEQLSLRWNNFHSNLTSGFYDLLETADMVDVTIAVDGHFLQAHKIVLSICSPYFKQMFRVNPCPHPIVVLQDVGHENMKDILQFMYMGEVSVLRENLPSFLRTAEVLQVKGLTGDDTSDNESRKGDKLDLDNDDDETFQYNQIIEPEVTLPTHMNTPNDVTPPSSNKRHAKSVKNNSKRSKQQQQDAQLLCQNQVKTETDTVEQTQSNNDFDTNNISCNSNTDNTEVANEENKNLLFPNYWDNIMVTPPNDSSTTDQDTQIFSAEKTHVFCPYCCRKFVNRYNLKIHIRDKHEDHDSTNLDCRICGKTMRNQSCLRVHMYHHRKQTESETTP